MDGTLRYRAAYSRFWPLVRAFLAILNFFPAFAVAVAAKDTVWSAIRFSSQARIWALGLLFVVCWIAAQKIVATLLERLLQAVGLIGTLVIDSEGISLATRAQTQTLAWREMRSVSTSVRNVSVSPNPVSRDPAAAAVAVPIVEAASRFASGLWVLGLTDGTKQVVIEGAALVWPVAAEKKILAALQAELGVDLKDLDTEARVEVAR